MKNRLTIYRYYRVNLNDTAIIEISTNDFLVLKLKDRGKPALQQDAGTYYLFTDIGKAMEKAKSGAQACIEQLIDKGDEGMAELLQYRMDHYEDLHINLVDANIRVVENKMQEQPNYIYKPYRIDPEYNTDRSLGTN